MTSVFAQLDSESEELLKCGVKLFLVQQDSAFLTVSFHIGYVHCCRIICKRVGVNVSVNQML